MTRVIARKQHNSEAPVLWIELPDGRGVALWGNGRCKVHSVERTKNVFAFVEQGEYDEWERVA